MDREPRLEWCFLIIKRHSTLFITLSLFQNLESLDISHVTIKLITDFFTNRQQRVKLGEDCFSEWGNVPVGVPQGTELGPWLFALMMNDLGTTRVNNGIKFVNDLTESVPKFAFSQIQDSVTKIQD